MLKSARSHFLIEASKSQKMGARFTKRSKSNSVESRQKDAISNWSLDANCNLCNLTGCGAILLCCNHSFHKDCLLDQLSSSVSRMRRCPSYFSPISSISSINARREWKSGQELNQSSWRDWIEKWLIKVSKSDPETETTSEIKSADNRSEKCIIWMDIISTRAILIPCAHAFDFILTELSAIQSKKCHVSNSAILQVDTSGQSSENRLLTLEKYQNNENLSISFVTKNYLLPFFCFKNSIDCCSGKKITKGRKEKKVTKKRRQKVGERRRERKWEKKRDRAR